MRKRSDSKIFICGRLVGAIDSESFRELTAIAGIYFFIHGCVTFRIRGLQTSFTKTNAKVFSFGRLNLYTPGPLQFLGIGPTLRVS